MLFDFDLNHFYILVFNELPLELLQIDYFRTFKLNYKFKKFELFKLIKLYNIHIINIFNYF